MSLLTLRVAGMGDALALAALSGQLGYPTSAAESANRLAAILGSPDHAVFVACIESDVVDWIHVFFCLINSSKHTPL